MYKYCKGNKEFLEVPDIIILAGREMSQEQTIDIRSWLRLVHADGVGSRNFFKLLDYFGTVEAVLGSSSSRLQQVEGIGAKISEQICRSRDTFDAEGELNLAAELGIDIIAFSDCRYPVSLKKIYAPPAVIYVKGKLLSSDSLSVSIVGCRRCSHYGTEQAGKFAHLLSSSGFTIVSGMARGIDTAAHKGALASGGRTIAVQGCGLANIFPPENKELFARISASGACISELPLNYEPLAANFPARNRIIAGLSLAVIVVEAASRSGALLTAKSAMEENREVMAVPGRIDSPLSSGPHQLIKQGAKLVETVEDVLETLEFFSRDFKQYVSQQTAATASAVESANSLFAPENAENSNNTAAVHASDKFSLPPSERAVFDCLTSEPAHIEQIISASSLDAGAVSSSLVSLRLKGLVRQSAGNFFSRR